MNLQRLCLFSSLWLFFFALAAMAQQQGGSNASPSLRLRRDTELFCVAP
jgi:hypothetical protein